jgi:hypothetical protein
VSYYLMFQADDGFDSGDWFASSTELSYSFSDSAGLCTCEMYAVGHWVRLATLHYWYELVLIAERYGAVLEPSQDALPVLATMTELPALEMYADVVDREMNAELTGRAARVFFLHEGNLAYAETSESADDGHEICLYGGERMTLGDLPAAQRARVAELVRTGRCACEPCQRLREHYDFPLASEPADAAP